MISGNPSTGQFEVMSENDPVGGAGEQSLTVDLSGGHDGEVDFHGTWTTASWLELASSSGATIANGTFVQVAGSPEIYVIAGGAPLYVSNWAAVGGSQPFTVISQAQFNSLNYYPADGTFLRDEAGTIWRVAGGDPLYVNTCAPADMDGCAGVIAIDGADVANAGQGAPWNHLATSIGDGTYVRIADGANYGWIARAAGGTLLHLSSCAPAELSGCGTAVNVPQYTYSAYMAAHPTIADGTFVRIADGANYGWIARAAGGTLLHLSSCTPAALAGCVGAVNVNQYSYSTYVAAHPTIANGAYLRIADGSDYGWIGRGVGGALIHLSSCAPAALSGCGSAVNVNQYSYDIYTAAHAHPANGSAIEKLPSGTFWRFDNGVCIAGKSTSSAVAVNDNSVSCVGLPAVRTTSLPAGKVRAAYTRTLAAAGGASPYTWAVSSGTLPPGLKLSARGVLSGKPTKAGTWTFTVKVTDEAGQAATRKLALAIKS